MYRKKELQIEGEKTTKVNGNDSDERASRTSATWAASLGGRCKEAGRSSGAVEFRFLQGDQIRPGARLRGVQNCERKNRVKRNVRAVHEAAYIVHHACWRMVSVIRMSCGNVDGLPDVFFAFWGSEAIHIMQFRAAVVCTAYSSFPAVSCC